MNDEIIESAKAVQEVAKTAGKAIDMSYRFGIFIKQYVDASLSAAFGIFEDKLKYMRSGEHQVKNLFNGQTNFYRRKVISSQLELYL